MSVTDIPLISPARRLREAALPTLAGVLVLTASYLNFISSNDYPLFSAEVGIVLLVLISLGLLIGAVYAMAEKWGRILLNLILIYVAIDINFDGFIVPIIFLCVSILANRFSNLFLSIISLLVILFSLTNLSNSSVHAERYSYSTPNSTLPVLLHIILDEHIGADGIRQSDTPARRMSEKLKRFYTNNGFKMFTGAYSEYFRTENSIPDILNYGTPQTLKGKPYEGGSVEKNAYFDDIGQMGYNIHVIQTDFLKYCKNESVKTCRTVHAFDLRGLRDNGIPVGSKSSLMLYEFAKLSLVAKVTASLIDDVSRVAQRNHIPIPSPHLGAKRLPDAVGALKVLRELPPLLRDAKPGNAFFVHVLIPHYPYVMDPQCRVKPVSMWANRRSEKSVEVRDRAYFDQLDCVLSELKKIVDDVPTGAIVIVHGDHGSRITVHDPVIEEKGHFSDKDVIAGYSTLFAVRAPGISGGEVGKRFPIAKLLQTLVSSKFTSAVPNLGENFVPTVMLGNLEWRPIERYELPDWWVKAASTKQSF